MKVYSLLVHLRGLLFKLYYLEVKVFFFVFFYKSDQSESSIPESCLLRNNN